MGMSMYDIDEAMLALVDDETGEITDIEAFEQLSMAREEKIENVALWHKNLMAEIQAFKTEEANLKARRQAAERKAERLKEYLTRWLDGQKFETPRVSCKWRKSSGVVVSDPASFIDWAQQTPEAETMLKYAAPEISLTGIKDYLKAHEDADLPFVTLEQRNSLSIK